VKTEDIELIIEGVRVRVRLDEFGRPLTLRAGTWVGDDRERLTRLALRAAEALVRRAADQKLKAARDAIRTAESATTRRKNAAKHSSHEWLQAAHNKFPTYKAGRLVHEARRLANLKAMCSA
jgi:hypothetical protein